MQTFIVHKDKKILRVYETSQGLEGVELSIQNEGITGTIVEVPNLFKGFPNQDIREFTLDWDLKSLKDRVQYRTIPDDEIYDEVEDKIRKKTLKEKVDSGLETLDPDMKLNEDGTEKIRKSWTELIAEKLKTYDEWISQIVRPYRNILLAETDTIYCNPERWWGYSDEQKTAWSHYKQQLRDFTQQELEVVNGVEVLPWPRRPA